MADDSQHFDLKNGTSRTRVFMLNENKHIKKFTKIIKAAKMVQKRPRKSDHLLWDEVQVYKETSHYQVASHNLL